MVDLQSPTAEIRRGKKEKERRRYKPQLQNIMACPLLWTAIKKLKQVSSPLTTSGLETDRANSGFGAS